jgi:hypothetical protein
MNKTLQNNVQKILHCQPDNIRKILFEILINDNFRKITKCKYETSLKIISIIYTKKHPALVALPRTRRGIASSSAGWRPCLPLQRDRHASSGDRPSGRLKSKLLSDETL